MKVGFIGLGTMGSSMAYNTLQGGHELVVHDIQRESATRHLEAGATWADTPRQVAEAEKVREDGRGCSQCKTSAHDRSSRW